MAEFKEPPRWKAGDLITSANLNIYSDNDLYFNEKIEYLESSVGAGVFKKIKEVVLTEVSNRIDVTNINLTKNKIYYCFLIGGLVPRTENSIRIYFNGDYEHTLYNTSYFLFKDYTLTTGYEIGPLLSKAQESHPLFIPFKIIIVEVLGLFPGVIVEKHKTGAHYYPWTYEGFIRYGRSTEITSICIKTEPDNFFPNTKLTIWESAFI